MAAADDFQIAAKAGVTPPVDQWPGQLAGFQVNPNLVQLGGVIPPNVPGNPNNVPASIIGKTYYLETVKEPVSPSEEFRNDGSLVTRTFLIDWDKRGQAIRDIVGFPSVTAGQAGGSFVQRNLPMAYLDFLNSTNQPFLFCTQIRQVEGVGTPLPSWFTGVVQMKNVRNVARYNLAKVSVVYESLTYDILSDAEMIDLGYVDSAGNPDESSLARYVTKQVSPAADYLTSAYGSFKYVEAGKTPVKGEPGKIVPNYDLSLTWEQVPESCVGTTLFNPTLTTPPIDILLGTVNRTAFAGLAIGTVLFTAAIIKRIRSAIGDRLCSVEYRFKWFNPGLDALSNPIGHNYLYTPGPTPTSGYYEVTTDGTTNLVAFANSKNIYNWSPASVPFESLFRVPS